MHLILSVKVKHGQISIPIFGKKSATERSKFWWEQFKSISFGLNWTYRLLNLHKVGMLHRNWCFWFRKLSGAIQCFALLYTTNRWSSTYPVKTCTRWDRSGSIFVLKKHASCFTGYGFQAPKAPLLLTLMLFCSLIFVFIQLPPNRPICVVLAFQSGSKGDSCIKMSPWSDRPGLLDGKCQLRGRQSENKKFYRDLRVFWLLR